MVVGVCGLAVSSSASALNVAAHSKGERSLGL